MSLQRTKQVLRYNQAALPTKTRSLFTQPFYCLPASMLQQDILVLKSLWLLQQPIVCKEVHTVDTQTCLTNLTGYQQVGRIQFNVHFRHEGSYLDTASLCFILLYIFFGTQDILFPGRFVLIKTFRNQMSKTFRTQSNQTVYLMPCTAVLGSSVQRKLICCLGSKGGP